MKEHQDLIAWARALPRWRARGRFSALSSQSGRRGKPIEYFFFISNTSPSNLSSSNLPTPLLLLLLLLHHSRLNNCHRTFDRRHGYRVAGVLLFAKWYLQSWWNLLHFYILWKIGLFKDLVEDPKKLFDLKALPVSILHQWKKLQPPGRTAGCGSQTRTKPQHQV